MILLLFIYSLASGGQSLVCEDAIDFCDSLSPICIGSIIQYHFDQIQSVADQIENSTAIPALQNALPATEDEIPLVGSSKDGTTPPSFAKELENSLPLLKESLPLIRESLPLIRESLPLIRKYYDPLFMGDSDKSTCQKKAYCKTCRECPKMREAITRLVESLCPKTCHVCDSFPANRVAAEELVDYYQ